MATNEQRTARTRASLLKAARAEFAAHGYADAATTAIVSRAGATRGALYHHFKDKLALFDAVVEAEDARLAQLIDDATEDMPDAFKSLRHGIGIYLDTATAPATRRILMLDGPSALGWTRWREIQSRHSLRTLREGLEAAQAQGALTPDLSVPVTASLFAAALDEAVHVIAESRNRRQARAQAVAAAEAMLDGLKA
ncbi:TetR family transcriptional regulator [Pyruvatibacter mobilis]|uniref:TetR family transcriptional regulator n=1 Tax=Pyruvatibacter mobilis TaxID=1712261 RepID=UPI003D144A1E